MRPGPPAGQPALCGEARLSAYAAQHGVSRKEAMARLLARDIWPQRFSRNVGLLSPDAQIRLLDLPILIAGCGGLGGSVADLLVRLGAGNIRLYDHDRFEESNLNRQRFCSEATLGQHKAEAVARGLQEIASFGEYTPVVARLTTENLPACLAGCEIVVDCLDSVAGKKMLETAARTADIAWLHGSVLHNEGFASIADPAHGTLARLYPVDSGASGAGPVLSHVVAGTAALMCSLFTNWLLEREKRSPLIHADFSVPELETFSVD